MAQKELPAGYNTWLEVKDKVINGDIDPNESYLIGTDLMKGNDIACNIGLEFLKNRPTTAELHRIQTFFSTSYIVVPKEITSTVVKLYNIAK